MTGCNQVNVNTCHFHNQNISAVKFIEVSMIFLCDSKDISNEEFLFQINAAFYFLLTQESGK